MAKYNTEVFDCSADDRPVNAFAKERARLLDCCGFFILVLGRYRDGRGAQVFVECDAWRPVAALAKSLFAVEA